MIPYGKQSINQNDVYSVIEALKSDRITQGNKVIEFERALANYTGAKFCVVCNNGTAALHSAYAAANLGPGDEFITSPLTFVATANAGVWQGATPVFVDIDPKTGNIDPQNIESAITQKTKVIAPIDYAGRPSDYLVIKDIARKHNLMIVEDACQGLGGAYYNKKVGSITDLSVFSFHPVKSITTGEGGAILTDDEILYKKMKQFITHGVNREDFIYPLPGPWYFEMQQLGINYRLTDIQCALGISQLKRLDKFIERRREIAKNYTKELQNIDQIITPPMDTGIIQSAWHLYVVRLTKNLVSKKRRIVEELHKEGIGVQVHHVPVHTHPYYVERFGTSYGDYPKAEAFYEAAFSLPIYPTLSINDQQKVIDTLKSVIKTSSQIQ